MNNYTCNKKSIYIVQKGDSLSIIAKRTLGNLDRWSEIASINELKHPFIILVGQRLYLPEKEQHSSIKQPSFNDSNQSLENSFNLQCNSSLLNNNTLTVSENSKNNIPDNVAKEVLPPPVTFKLDKEVPVIKVTYPLGKIEIGFTGELTYQLNKNRTIITATSNGVSNEFLSLNKDIASKDLISFFEGIKVDVDEKGINVTGIVGVNTQWFSGKFEFQGNEIKYELSPQSIQSVKTKDGILSGNVSCWIKVTGKLPPISLKEKLVTALVVTMAQLREFSKVILDAGTKVAVPVGVTITFVAFMNMLMNSALGLATGMFLIIVPPEMQNLYNNQNAKPNSPPQA